MLAELELNVPTSEMDAMHDPYMTAGYGVNSYFENLAAISMMFIAISLCALPVFWIYSQGRSFEGYAMQPVAQFFIGNAGASATACRQSRVGEGFIDVSCPSSNILDGKSAVFGFISTEFARFTACHPAALEKDIVERGHHNCTAAVSSSQRNELALSIKQKCHGKTRCKVDFSAVNFRSLHNDPKGTKACNENAYFFLQMPCLIPREALPVRKVMGLFVCVFAVFVYFLVFVLVDYQRSAEAHKFVDWDVKTITAADYSVEFNIPESMYEAFVTRFHDPTNPISEIGQLRLYIKHEMERRLSAFPPLGMDGPEGDEMPVKIAMITFAFDNAEIIHGLRQRGKAIRNEQWYSLALINKRLTDRLHNSQELLDKMQTPVSCFITLETEEGKCRADRYNETVQTPEYRQYGLFLGHETDVQPATEPTDIIWENRHITGSRKHIRLLMVVVLLCLMLSVSFALIYHA